jgi:2-isopropylmalate synthase
VRRITILDTTLRDGEQAPGAALTSDEKIEVARALARLGVDVIEAGFPAASPDDWDAVRRIADDVGSRPTPGRPQAEPPTIQALARANAADIDRAAAAIIGCAHPRLHVFIATSDIHMQHKLRMTREEVLATTSAMVKRARGLVPEVEFSPEDAGRSDKDFLRQVLTAAIEAGATTLNIPDTVGYTTPGEYGELIASLIATVPGADQVVWSLHCHDDLGLACANTLAGLVAGAGQAEVTINGIGERAGNCALEELVMILHTRRETLGLETGIDTTQLCRTSRLVSRATGFAVPPNKAVVGTNAFAHESGIHQHGMLKHRNTYEIMTPETVGANATRLVLGKHSGRHAFAARLGELGAPLEGEYLDRAFARFKQLADRKKEIHDADLIAIAADEVAQAPALWALEALQVGCGTIGMPTATVKLHGPDGRTRVHAAVGAGPVDACFKAVDEIVKTPLVLEELGLTAVTEGLDALGEVSVRVRWAEGEPRIYHGCASDLDVVVASVKAYLDAINRALASRPDALRLARPEVAAIPVIAEPRPARIEVAP